MKTLKSIRWALFCFFIFSFGNALASNFYVINQTGKDLDVQVRRIKWGFAFPYTKTTQRIEHRHHASISAYRLSWVKFLMPSNPGVRIISIDGDPRLKTLCKEFQKFNKSRCFQVLENSLRGSIHGNQLTINQGVLDNNAIPVVCVVTLNEDGNIILTRLDYGVGLDLTVPNRFFYFLEGKDLAR